MKIQCLKCEHVFGEIDGRGLRCVSGDIIINARKQAIQLTGCGCCTCNNETSMLDDANVMDDGVDEIAAKWEASTPEEMEEELTEEEEMRQLEEEIAREEAEEEDDDLDEMG